MNYKSAFEVLKAGSHKTLRLGVDMLVYVAEQLDYTDDPAFGKVFNTTGLTRTIPTYGRVWSTRTEENGSVAAIAILTDSEGNEILDGGEPIFHEFRAEMDQKIGVNIWCNDVSKVEALCDKHNGIAIAEFENMLDLLKSKENNLRETIRSINTSRTTAIKNASISLDLSDRMEMKNPLRRKEEVKEVNDTAKEYFDQKEPVAKEERKRA